MNQSPRGLWGFVSATALVACSLLATLAVAQSSSNLDQWIHVRVESREDKTETVRVNVPVDMAVKVLPAIKNKNLCDGKVHIDSGHIDDVDLHTMLDAVRTAKDGEYVTVESKDDNVRVAKSSGYLYIHVTEKKPSEKTAKATSDKDSAKNAALKKSKVEVKIPMKVVDALLSAGKDQLDVVAALRALSANGDMELVSVKDDDSTVRVWIDSKNVPN
ncbi:MAG TPA: hypothetical protein VKB61_15515 [Candidatus Acidoferrum sp.]|nr:hypothetical protein [Candidatus Acidoferrum sp.]